MRFPLGDRQMGKVKAIKWYVVLLPNLCEIISRNRYQNLCEKWKYTEEFSTKLHATELVQKMSPLAIYEMAQKSGHAWCILYYRQVFAG